MIEQAQSPIEGGDSSRLQLPRPLRRRLARPARGDVLRIAVGGAVVILTAACNTACMGVIAQTNPDWQQTTTAPADGDAAGAASDDSSSEGQQ